MTAVYQIVQEKIRDLISNGEIGLGQKLPSERTLAERFGVSRNSVREAIRGLTEKNVLESRRGDGTYLRGGHEDLPVLPLGRSLQSDTRRLKEIFELRRMLEPQIAALAAGRITKRDLKALKMLVFEQEKRNMCGQDDAELDAAFHLRIAEAADNELIVEVLRTLDHILSESRSAAHRNEERQRVSMRTHYLIVDALERRDPESAKQAMISHLLDVEATILSTEQR